MPRADFDLYLITDRRQCTVNTLQSAVEQALRAGVRAVQLREKDLSTRERFELGAELRRVTSAFDAKLFVNGDAALALAIHADGVHLPQDGLPADVCRAVVGSRMLIGVSSHSFHEAEEAEKRGADFITYGPVYHTPSKARYGPPVGVDSLRAVCSTATVPVLALGGIKPDTVEEVLTAGAAGIAMISAVLAAPDIESAVREIRERVSRARSAGRFSKKEG